MDIEEMMIDYIMNHASNEEIQEFFGYADYGILSANTFTTSLLKQRRLLHGMLRLCSL